MMKSLGLAVLAVLALTVVVAPAAQASPYFECKALTKNCSVSGESNNVEMKMSTGTFKCIGNSKSGASGFELRQGTMKAIGTSMSAYPVFTGCKFAGVSLSINGGNCKFSFGQPEGTGYPYAVTMDILCPEGSAIKMTSPALDCAITVGPQTGLLGSTMQKYTVEGKPAMLSATLYMTGITYTETGSDCGAPGTHSNGALSGIVPIKAFEDYIGGPQVALSIQP